MQIHLYTVSLNEMRMLGFFFRHYEPWVTRFVVFDDRSTDGTAEFLRSKPNVEVRVREYSDPQSLVLSGKTIHDHCWKESRCVADWVVVADIDEHLHHADIKRYLGECKRDGVTLIPALGYEMSTDDFPAPDEHLASVRTVGAPTAFHSKLSIFDPAAIDEVDYSVGAHTAAPSGRIVLPPKDELLLLHYKHLGMDYVLERNRLLRSGRRARDHENGWGWQYAFERADLERVRGTLAQTSVDVRDPCHVPQRDHGEPRWWRKPPASPDPPPESRSDAPPDSGVEASDRR